MHKTLFYLYIKHIAAGRTNLMIAHRFNTRQSPVAMLGTAKWYVESDSHEQLLKKNGANSGIDPKRTERLMRKLGFEVYGGNDAVRVG